MRNIIIMVISFLILSLVLSTYLSQAWCNEIVTGQETTVNQLPGMTGFSASGGTSVGTGRGCAIGEYCTSGKNEGGGTYSSSFNLQNNMTIDQINRGFKMNYGMDVKSHPSNTTVPTCAGNTMAAFDCKDIFKLTVSLFDENTVLQHKFEHQVELTYSGTQTYLYSQTIPENTYAALTGNFEMYGIDAGYPTGYYGPSFSNPALTATYDLVTLIETEIIDIIDLVDVLPPDTNIDTAIVDLAPPSAESEMQAEVESEMSPPTPDGMGGTVSPSSSSSSSDQAASSETPPVSQEQQQQEEVQQEVETEMEQEIQQETTEPEPEPETAVASNEPEETEPEPVKVVVKKAVKEKIAKKILKRMGDKGRYDASNQLRTLVVMQVLGNSKAFFAPKVKLQDTAGFFSDARIPDSTIKSNNFAQYIMFGGSSAQHDALTALQYKR
tara:strand:+ start:1121 stop:2437 length:1317 start_codon:yes stop_codon:yes gene_type:complete